MVASSLIFVQHVTSSQPALSLPPLLKPRRAAGEPIRIPEVTNGLLGSFGTLFLFTVMLAHLARRQLLYRSGFYPPVSETSGSQYRQPRHHFSAVRNTLPHHRFWRFSPAAGKLELTPSLLSARYRFCHDRTCISSEGPPCALGVRRSSVFVQLFMRLPFAGIRPPRTRFCGW